MRITKRDAKITKDIALSHVMSRDQAIRLGYFGSITRANARLRELCSLGLIKRLSTPFFGQGLYSVAHMAVEIVGPKIARLISGRRETPRFIQHALCVTNVRIALQERGVEGWKFEQQVTTEFDSNGKTLIVKPDGLAIQDGRTAAIEVDLGHVAPSKYAEKLKAYHEFASNHTCEDAWGTREFELITVTTGKLRASHLLNLTPKASAFKHTCRTFEELGLPVPGNWS